MPCSIAAPVDDDARAAYRNANLLLMLAHACRCGAVESTGWLLLGRVSRMIIEFERLLVFWLHGS